MNAISSIFPLIIFNNLYLCFSHKRLFDCLVRPNSLNAYMERGSSVVECWTRNGESQGSNPPLVPFRRLGIVGIAAWLECFPGNQSWRRNEHVCQGRQKVSSALSGLDLYPVSVTVDMLYGKRCTHTYDT